LIVIEGPIAADGFGPFIAGVAGAARWIGAGAGLRIGSSCGRKVFGSSFRLFHILGM
jgi:hypothetical protein